MKYRTIMNHQPLGIAFLATTSFVVRCKPSAGQSATETRDTTAQQFGKTKLEGQEAAPELKHGFQQARRQVNLNLAA